MAGMQIFPTENMVVVKGREITDPAITEALLPEWRSAQRVLIQDDGTIFIGLPATKYDGGMGLGLMDEIAKIPSVAKALDDRRKAIKDDMDARHRARVEGLKMAVHPMAIVAKKDGTYWLPTMPGYDAQFLDPSAGDRLYSRAADAERDGYRAGVPFETAAEPHPKRRKKG